MMGAMFDFYFHALIALEPLCITRWGIFFDFVCLLVKNYLWLVLICQDNATHSQVGAESTKLAIVPLKVVPAGFECWESVMVRYFPTSPTTSLDQSAIVLFRKSSDAPPTTLKEQSPLSGQSPTHLSHLRVTSSCSFVVLLFHSTLCLIYRTMTQRVNLKLAYNGKTYR